MHGTAPGSIPPPASLLQVGPDGLFEVGPVSDGLAWLSIGLFVLAALLEWRQRRRAGTSGSLASGASIGKPVRVVAFAAWLVFAAFWLNLVPHFAFVHQSYVEGILSLVAVPASAYVGWLVYSGRDTLFVLTRAVAVMGVVYLPFETIPALSIAGVALPAPRQVLIEHTAVMTAFVMEAVGYTPEMIESSEGYDATFRWLYADGGEEHAIYVTVVLACTGIGSMSIFAGLIAAVRAPLVRKLRALALAIGIIYVLNVLRTSFITIVTGNQYMRWFPEAVLFLFGETNPYRVSFLVSDRIISQVLAVVALIGVTYLVVRQLPELLIVLEDVLYVLTGEEHDLQEVIDLPREPTNLEDRGRPATTASVDTAGGGATEATGGEVGEASDPDGVD
ncbi:cytochrome oxidase subunit I [Halalkaliarchaeum desulfuricum]|uniref:Cytochrome oxidase subunit I n=1 Tax=Halalkaliarchaeum desulfuricum TaxID=2055893 RepID=A0A343TFA1_9EURY|nr:archaeosortase A [Halalkaliarchaeum desulfuricum]AUX07773.1 cytochrome oxidase subunit I [Halalkaliarchaeum desulfuricum]